LAPIINISIVPNGNTWLLFDIICQLTDSTFQGKFTGQTMTESRAGLDKQLREAIKACGESKYIVGNKTGVDSGVISRFMNRRRGISLATASRLCEYLGLRLTKKSDAERLEGYENE
jgi:hypothetical protein